MRPGFQSSRRLMAGLPIAWARTRDNNAIVARLSLGLWIACVFVNAIVMLYFALYVPAPPPPAVQAAAPHRAQPAVRAPNLSEDEIERLDDEIRWRWYLVNDYGEELATAKGAKRERLLSAEDRRRYAIAKTELEQFEIRRYGAPVVMKDLDPSRNGPGQLEVQGYAASSEPAQAQAPAVIPAPAPQGPGLGLAMISLIMIAASALGLLISAESLAAVMLSKVREGQGAAGRGPGAGSRPPRHRAAHPRWRKHRRLRFVDRQMPVACEEQRSAARHRRSLTTRRSARRTTSAPTSTNRTSTPGSPSTWAPSTASPRRTRTARSTGAWRSSMTTKWARSTGMPARSTAMPEHSTDMRGRPWDFGFGRARWTTPPGRSTS